MSQNEHTNLLNELKNTKKHLEDLKQENYILSEQLKMKSTHLHLILKNTPVLLFGLSPSGFIELSVGQGLEHLQIHAATYIGQLASNIFQDNNTLIKGIEEGMKGNILKFNASFLQFENVPIAIEPVFDENNELIHLYIISYIS